MFRLLYRHLREIQFPDPLTRFSNLGYQPTDILKEPIIADAFEALNFSN